MTRRVITEQRIPRTGLRLRIASVIAGIVLVAVTAVGVAVHALLARNTITESRRAADAQVHAAMDIYANTGLLSFDAAINDPSLPDQLRGTLTGDGSRGTYVTGLRTRQLWAAGMVQGKTISIHTTFKPVDDNVRAVDQAMLIAGVVTVLLASGIGALSASRLSRRLRLAARVAGGRAAPGDHQQPQRSLRDAVGPGQDEVGELADAVDAMAGRLAERLQAEQRFTADVAHDLRTPLAGLVASAALLDDSRPAQLVRERAAAMTTLVEELLEVARLDAGAETAELEYVSIPDVLDRAVKRGVAKGEYPADAVRLHADETPEPARVLTDPRRLERVLSNLVRNGLRHGKPPVEIISSGRSIRVFDHGPGFPDRLLERGPQLFNRSSEQRRGSHGLGLVIASGQARVLGAELHFSNPEQCGAQVTILLPAKPETVSPSESETLP